MLWRPLILQPLLFGNAPATPGQLNVHGGAACSDSWNGESFSFVQASFRRSAQTRANVTLAEENGNSALGGTDHYMFIHIPKCAGTSFKADAALVVAPAPFQENEEKPWQSTPHSDRQVDLVIFRSPLLHVLSQFMECKYDYWGGMTTAGTAFPTLPGLYGGFAEWIDHFVQLQDTPVDGELPDTEEWTKVTSYRCYNPWNMQTRYLATEWSHAAPYPMLEPDLTIALNTLKSVQFVGLSEFYVESLCLLSLHRYGTAPETCACNGTGPLNVTSHIQHFVPEHAITDLPLAVVEKMHKLVRQDAQLYAAVLNRFEADLRKASMRTGVQMVCPEKFDQQWLEVEKLLRELGLGNVTTLKRSKP